MQTPAYCGHRVLLDRLDAALDRLQGLGVGLRSNR